MSNNYYQTLGIDKSANQEDIKKAFRKLAHQYHPDKNGGDGKKFKEINEAYQVLSDQKKRQQYDQFGRVFDGQPGAGQGGFDFNSFSGAQGFNFSGINLDDILENLTGFGFNRKKRQEDLNRGRDIQVGLTINLENTLKDFEETIFLDKMAVCQRCEGKGGEPGSKVKECFSCRGKGWVEEVKRTILGAVSRQVTCPECQGEGKIPEKPCNVCSGQGRVKNSEQIKINVPAGVDSGQTLKAQGKGEAGRRGGQAGDLFIKIIVKAHKVFQRKGDDLIARLNIPFSLSALGGQAEVPSLEGKSLSLKVPPGTPSGKVFRLSGKGIPHFHGWGRGALFVELNITTPKKLTRQQKDLLTKLRKEGL